MKKPSGEALSLHELQGEVRGVSNLCDALATLAEGADAKDIAYQKKCCETMGVLAEEISQRLNEQYNKVGAIAEAATGKEAAFEQCLTAFEFYAEEDNYKSLGGNPAAVMEDKGRIARDAFATFEEGEETE